MRLPFGLGRRHSSDAGGSPVTTDEPASGAPAPGPPPVQRAWASLPPIQRTAGDMPLVADPGEFAGALPGTTGLPPIVEPLGHEVSPLATPGLVVARTRAVEAPTGPAMPAPVQRRTGRSGRPSAAASVAGFELDEDPVGPGDDEVAATAVTPEPAAGPPPPIRALPTVSRMAVRVPDRPLTSAASTVPTRSRSSARTDSTPGATRAPAGSDAAAAPATPALTGMRRSVKPLATKPVLSRTAAADVAATTSPDPLPDHRPGLGEPLDALPPTALPVSARTPARVIPPSPGARTVSRSAAADAPDAVPALAPVAGPGRAPHIGARPAADGDRPLTATVAPGLPELPVLPVARRAGGSSASGSVPIQRSGGAASPAAPAPSRPVIRPILAGNPIIPAIPLQRQADARDGEADAKGGPVGQGADAGFGPVGAGSGSSDAAPDPLGEMPGIQRLAASPDTPARATWAKSQAHPQPTIQRERQAAAVPRSSTPVMRPGRPVEEVGPVVASARPGDALAARSPLPALRTPVIQALPMTGAAPSVQPTASPATTSPPTTSVQRDTIPSRPAQPASPPARTETPVPGHSDRELDDLAQALFGRIRSRLRTELIHDREAKGLSFDHI